MRKFSILTHPPNIGTWQKKAQAMANNTKSQIFEDSSYVHEAFELFNTEE